MWPHSQGQSHLNHHKALVKVLGSWNEQPQSSIAAANKE